MSFTTYSEYKPTKQIIWQHHWDDGSKIELTQDCNDWILVEYHSDGSLAWYEDPYGNPTSEERFSKRKWRLKDAIADIKDEYELGGYKQC